MAIDYVNREGLEYFHSKLKTYLSTKYATKEELEAAIANFGGFQVVSLNQQGKPDVANPSTKIIYLTKEADSQKTDPYTEWICTNTTGPVWEIIGETTPEINEMIGATASTAGTAGLVPAPAAGDQGKVLTGDGNWSEVEEYTTAYIDDLDWNRPGFVNIGGRDYSYIRIGNQLWLAENLDYQWTELTIINSYPLFEPYLACYYNYNRSNYSLDGTYKTGLLYSWDSVNYLETNKSTLLPTGWRVPSKSDYETLSAYISTSVGQKIRAKDGTITSDFPSNWGSTDEYGFSALPSGRFVGYSLGIGTEFYVWTSTYYRGSNAYYVVTDSNNSFFIGDQAKTNMYAVRLVKDVT